MPPDTPAAGAPPDHKQVFATTEFDLWSDRQGLEAGEAFLIARHLDAPARTLEAGCGGGRLLLAMQARGFTRLHGFDYLAEFVAAAQRRDASGQIDYQVQDARALDYADGSFDQLVYLQQVLCFLSSHEDRRSAIREAARVLRPGGTLVASFLSIRDRNQSWFYKPFMAYLYVLRKVLGIRRGRQQLPWLRLASRANFGALLDRGPYVYWFEEREAWELFASEGLTPVAIGSDAQVAAGALLTSLDELARSPFTGRLYLVCRKS